MVTQANSWRATKLEIKSDKVGDGGGNPRAVEIPVPEPFGAGVGHRSSCSKINCKGFPLNEVGRGPEPPITNKRCEGQELVVELKTAANERVN